MTPVVSARIDSHYRQAMATVQRNKQKVTLTKRRQVELHLTRVCFHGRLVRVVLPMGQGLEDIYSIEMGSNTWEKIITPRNIHIWLQLQTHRLGECGCDVGVFPSDVLFRARKKNYNQRPEKMLLTKQRVIAQ